MLAFLFAVECGVRGPYTQSWVMPKYDFSVFDLERMLNYISLMFAADVDTARQLCPRQDDHKFDLREIRKLMGDYVIVGKLPGSKLHDLHRDGNGISEYTEFVSTLLGTDLERLCGTTRRMQDYSTPLICSFQVLSSLVLAVALLGCGSLR